MRLPRSSARRRQALTATLTAVLLAGCGTSAATTATSSTGSAAPGTVVTSDATTVGDALAGNIAVETGDTSYDEADATTVTLAGTGAESESDAVSSDDGTVTISAGGTYVLTGELTGQVVVDSAGDGVVRLVLDDATITSDTSAAISVVDAESVVVVLADGSSNVLTDAATYGDTSDEAPTGALFSTADLTIGGTGLLTITGNANNGIVGKDGLVITGGTIEVTSVDDGVIGKDYLVVTDGTITVDAVDDAITSDNTEDPGSGFVLVQGGDITVASQGDGLKGVQVLVAGGTIKVAGSTEAMEGSLIIIDDGDLELHSADDGINVASSDHTAATDGAGGGPGGETAADSSLNLVINGGALEVWSSGDGLDSDGSATITGGDIVVHGPTADGNGALDVNGRFEVTGGTLMATGSAGMMVAPATDSAQGWIATALGATAAAGSEVVITDADGAEVASYTPQKDFACVIWSAPDIEQGASSPSPSTAPRRPSRLARPPTVAAARWAADAMTRPPQIPATHDPSTEGNPMDTHSETDPIDQPVTENRSWRGLASSRRAMAAGAVAAGLALAGAGFGVGYAVGGDAASTDVAQQDQTEGDWGGHDFRGGPGGDMGGQPGVPPGGEMGGTPGQAPDFDGDGQPDTETDPDSGSDTENSTQLG